MKSPLLSVLVCGLLAASTGSLFAGVETNRMVARKILEEVLGQGKIEENEHLYSPKFTAHALTAQADRAEDREATKAWRTAFPDLKMTVTHVVAEGDYVTVRYIGEGTNTGSFLGRPPTNRFIRVTGITIFKLENAQITDEWTEFDEVSLLRQLAMLPPQA